MSERPQRFSLQAWLVAAFVTLGLIASIAVALVVLPSLEQSIRDEQAKKTGIDLLGDMRAAQPFSTPQLGPEVQNLAIAAGGAVRLWKLTTDTPALVAAGGPLDTLPAQGFSEPGQFIIDGAGTRKYKYEAVTIRGRRYIQAGYAARIDGRIDALLEAAIPVRGAEGQIGIFRRRTLLATGLVLVLASLAGLGIARLLGARIRGLADTARTLAAGDLSARAVEASPQELGSLGASLNTMAARLEGLVAEAVSDRDRARALVSSLSEGVLAVSEQGEVTVANSAAQRLLGIGTGATAVTVADLPPAVQDALRRPQEGLISVGPYEATLPGGIEVLLSVAPLARSAGVVLTMRDVTAERRLARARRDLIANVSHELKTPLTAIKGFMEFLENPDLAAEQRAEFVALMSQEVSRLERLVAEQLELARLDAGALTLGLEIIDLGEVAAEVAASRSVLAEREGIELTARPGPAPVMVDADPARVEQILLILLDNAIRHTPAGGKITVGVAADGPFGALSVRDTGSGIPYEAQPFVFDRFYQADTSRQGQGLGLGLAIARGLASAHGGSIAVQSAPQVGTVFTVRLPLAASEPAEAPRAPAPATP